MKLTGLAALPAALLAFSLFSPPQPVHASQEPVVKTASGTASWYGSKFHGRRTANGERYDMNQMTAAHRTLPFGTKVRVINERNGRAVVVRINDRGPFAGRRIIDLSRGAAGAIGMVNSGVARVKLEVLR